MRGALMYYLVTLVMSLRHMPLWGIYLILFLLLTGAWYLVVLGCVSIASAIMSFLQQS